MTSAGPYTYPRAAANESRGVTLTLGGSPAREPVCYAAASPPPPEERVFAREKLRAESRLSPAIVSGSRRGNYAECRVPQERTKDFLPFFGRDNEAVALGLIIGNALK